MQKSWIGVTILSFLVSCESFAATVMPFGRYVGHTTISGSHSSISTSLDVFQYQPSELMQFPRVGMILRLGFGALNSHEYVSFNFESVNYDFDSGNFALDTSENDLVFRAHVSNDGEGRTIIEGDGMFRSGGKFAHIKLQFLTDEPLESEEPNEPGEPSEPSSSTNETQPSKWTPTLSGSYSGMCAGKPSALNIMTARGQELQEVRSGLIDYRITARLGRQDDLCVKSSGNMPPVYCVQRIYADGQWSFSTNRLSLSSGNTTDQCVILNDVLHCSFHFRDRIERCELKRNEIPTPTFAGYATRSFHAHTTAEQRKPLAAPRPPNNSELIAAVSGEFYGYLHHELLNQYQPLRMAVLGSSTTENPHIPNMPYISGALTFMFGRGDTATSWTVPFERKSFYVRPGYSLESKQSDGFFVIDEWTAGAIRGTWYSRHFGRIGTIELIKGAELPALPEQAQLVRDPIGEFIGESGVAALGKVKWRLRFSPTLVEPDAKKSYFEFGGDYQMIDSILPIRRIDHGVYDFYSGHLNWLNGDGRETISGSIATAQISENGMRVIMPGAPNWGVILYDMSQPDLFMGTDVNHE